MPLNPKQTQEILNTIGHSPQKRLGQNFLIDGNIVNKSIALAEIKESDKVLEIGPGLGTLSKAILLKGCTLYAVEKDKTLANFLKNTLSPKYKNFHILEADCIQYPLGEIQNKKTKNHFKIVSNLPYAVASNWLENVLNIASPLPRLMVLMLQKEAAERYSSLPNSKSFGAISIFLQSAYYIDSTHTVSASCFHPKPKINSTLIRLNLRDNPIYFSKESRKLIRIIFTQRRKQISSICRKINSKVINSWLDKLWDRGYEKNIRAEEIDLSSWQLLGYKHKYAN